MNRFLIDENDIVEFTKSDYICPVESVDISGR